MIKRVNRDPSGMDAATTPPANQEREPKYHHIPPEILEKILLNLPVKSLVRFSCASKSWKSMISEPSFITKHRSHATKRIVINDNPLYFHTQAAFSCPLSSISSNRPIDDTTSFFCPFRASKQSDVKLRAFCDELWCVAVKKSLYLWNPSMGTYKKLPNRPHVKPISRYEVAASYVETVYGLGYDAVNDDYKLLRTCWPSKYSSGGVTLLYSLKNDSWRKIYEDFPGNSFPRSNGEFVNGAFHWMVFNDRFRYYNPGTPLISIISFDLSTEKYKEVPQPMYSPPPNSRVDHVEVTVLRGMLCVFLNYKVDNASVLWVMKDYGVEESWIKMYEIGYKNIPSILPKVKAGKLITLRPLYVFENGEIVIWVCGGYKDWEIVIYKNEQVIAHQEIVAPTSKAIPSGGGRSMVRGGFVYVESLISPAAWPPLCNEVQA